MKFYIYNERTSQGRWCCYFGEAKIYSVIPDYKLYLVSL